MVLVGGLIASKAFNNPSIERFQDSMKINRKNVTKSDYNKLVMDNSLNMVFLCVLIIVNIVPALLIAYHCSKTPFQKGKNMVLGLLFSDIYIFYYVLRKFYYKDKKYC